VLAILMFSLYEVSKMVASARFSVVLFFLLRRRFGARLTKRRRL
jgi:hypothetical protein